AGTESEPMRKSPSAARKASAGTRAVKTAREAGKSTMKSAAKTTSGGGPTTTPVSPEDSAAPTTEPITKSSAKPAPKRIIGRKPAVAAARVDGVDVTSEPVALPVQRSTPADSADPVDRAPGTDVATPPADPTPETGTEHVSRSSAE